MNCKEAVHPRCFNPAKVCDVRGSAIMRFAASRLSVSPTTIGRPPFSSAGSTSPPSTQWPRLGGCAPFPSSCTHRPARSAGAPRCGTFSGRPGGGGGAHPRAHPPSPGGEGPDQFVQAEEPIRPAVGIGNRGPGGPRRGGSGHPHRVQTGTGVEDAGVIGVVEGPRRQEIGRRPQGPVLYQ